MAFFKFRKGGEEPAAASPPVQSIELMRRRAKHRLIGAVLLVLVGVIGFPLVFDNQPRPVYVDIPIEIPDRNKVKPLTIPAPLPPAPVAEPVVPAAAPLAAPAAAGREVSASAAVAPAAAAPVAPARTASAPAAAASLPASAPLSKPVPAAATGAEDKAALARTEPVTQARTDDGAKAQALLEGRQLPASAAAGEARFVVQVGAFAEDARAREVRLKLERAGLKTYTHVAETKEGRRTRVRVGPFADKAEAQRVAEQVRALDLPAAILTL